MFGSNTSSVSAMKAGIGPEHLLRHREHQQAKQQREDRGRHAGTEQNRFRIVGIDELGRREEVLFLREHSGMRRHFQRQAQQRQGRQQFDQRRMLGVVAEVSRSSSSCSRQRCGRLRPRSGIPGGQTRQAEAQGRGAGRLLPQPANRAMDWERRNHVKRGVYSPTARCL